MIISTDWHLNEESADVVLGEVLPGLAAAALEAKDHHLVCLGDAWHFRYRASVRLQVALRDELVRHQSRGLRWTFLPGNHDMFDIHGRSIMEVFHDVPGVDVINEPRINADGLWIPYQISNAKFLEVFRKLSPHIASAPRVAFIHQGVKGALMNDTYADEHGLDPSVLDGWQVFSGHYHKRHSVGAITYVGSPYQTSMSEAGQEKGYAHWDAKGYLPVTTAWGPRHFKLDVIDAKSLDTSQFRPEDIVTIVTPASANVAAIGKKLAAAGITHSTVSPASVEHTEARMAVRDGASFEEHAQAYINLVAPPTLDKAQLLHIFKGISS